MRNPIVIAMLLLATLNVTWPTGAGAGTGCSATDDSSGMGGQKVECSFSCSKTAIINVEASAQDSDASISGTGRCGGVSVHCDDDSDTSSSCTDSGGPTSHEDGGGSCSASTDEFWDSGLYVNCFESSVKDPTPPVLPDIPTSPPCIKPLCNPDLRGVVDNPPQLPANPCQGSCLGNDPRVPLPPFVDVTPPATCLTVPVRACFAHTGTSTQANPWLLTALDRMTSAPGIHILMVDGHAIATSCHEGRCVPIAPACTIEGGRWGCAVGAPP